MTYLNKSLLAPLAILAFLPILSLGQEQMTPARFREIVETTGDSTPLIPQLAAAGPVWTNATVSITLKYEDGKSFEEEVEATAKTIKGKYIVTTVHSKFYKRPMNSIVAYDEKASDYKVWAIFGETVTEGHTVYDFRKKVFAWSSAYGDGFTELGVGSFSDSESSDRTFIFKNGVLFCTRESKTRPTAKAK